MGSTLCGEPGDILTRVNNKGGNCVWLEKSMVFYRGARPDNGVSTQDSALGSGLRHFSI